MVEIVKIDDEKWKESLNKALPVFKNINAELGIFVLGPGERSPEQGFSVHPHSEEYAYILKGEVTFCTDKECYHLKKGDLMYNVKGTPHYTENRGEKEAKILWVVSPPL
mgnify:CR=1 FL=1